MDKQSTGTLFAVDDFRSYVRAWARAKGRGEFRRIASTLNIHTTLLSQVMGGRKCFTQEQASRLCMHMGLNVSETDYFVTLVLIERAGTEDLKRIYQRQLEKLKEQAQEAKSRVPQAKSLSEQDRAVFYSSWQYGMIRLLTSIDRFQTAESIARQLSLSISRVKAILDFLASRKLCHECRDGRFVRTEKNTHIEARSYLAIRHHQNWRNKVIELHERMTADDLAFTAPVSISRKDIPKIRAILLDAISSISKIVENSPAEDVAYLGIDWIKM